MMYGLKIANDIIGCHALFKEGCDELKQIKFTWCLPQTNKLISSNFNFIFVTKWALKSVK